MSRLTFLVMGSLAAIAALAGSPAQAFTGHAEHVELVPEGTEWLVAHSGRTPWNHVCEAPRAFTVKHGESWVMKKGGPTGHFTRLYGQGIPVAPAVHADSFVAQNIADDFWTNNAELLPPGVEPSDLRFYMTGRSRGVRVMTHRQEHNGVEVLGSGTYLAVRNGRIVLMGARAFDVSPIETVPTRTKDQAATDATSYLKGRGIDAVAKDVRLAIMPLVSEDRVDYKLVYVVNLKGSIGRWTAFVDAFEPSVFALKDERLFMTGNIQLEHHDRNPNGGLISGPGLHLHLDYGTGTATTNLNGDYAVAGSSITVDADLSGPYVEVNNESGTDVELTGFTLTDGQNFLWTGDGSEEQQAQLDVYVSTSMVRDYMAQLLPDLGFLNQTFPVHPNQLDLNGDGSQDYCNAWSDGYSINFLKEGGYGSYVCNNTAMVADIVYHEYGHSVHAFSAYHPAGSQVFDSSVSEGLADTTSVAMTGDPIIGPYFVQSGGGIRDLEPDKIWPQDQSEDVHATGLILGGALWDLRKDLRTELGESTGDLTTDEIFTMIMRFAAEMDTTYEAALLADDDNGDLNDGTPNLCAINRNFDAHGLVLEGQGLLNLQHEQITAIDDPSVPIEVEATVTVPSEECATLGEVRVIYSTDEGENWSTVQMEDQGQDIFIGVIPTQSEGTSLWYRVEAEETEGGVVVVKPYNDAEPYYTTYVGPLKEILCDSFDSESTEWTHELLSGEPSEGADDWMWGEPNGTGGDPSEAFSAGGVWGNDLATLENWNGQYQPDKVNTLRSPEWDLSEYDMVRLRFRRWLTVEDGYFDQAKVYVNEQEVWANAGTPGGNQDPHDLHHVDREWVMYDVDITELAAGESSVQVRWELASDQGLQFGGWTIDDVCLYTTGELPEEDAGTVPADGGTDAAVTPKPPVSGCGCDVAGSTGGSFLEILAGLI